MIREGADTDYREDFYRNYGLATGHTGPLSPGERQAAAKQFAARWGGWLPADRSTPVLDIGCGSGLFLDYLTSQGFTNVLGIDRSAAEIERAVQSGILNVERADAIEFLRDKTEVFGFVSVLNVFEHLNKDEVLKLLMRLQRALRPGGLIVAVTPNGISPFSGATRYWDFSHELSFTPASWRQLAAATGFSPPVFEEYGPIPYSVPGFVRSALWRMIALSIEAMAWIEVGGPRDVSRVYTADMKVILTKRAV